MAVRRVLIQGVRVAAALALIMPMSVLATRPTKSVVSSARFNRFRRNFAIPTTDSTRLSATSAAYIAVQVLPNENDDDLSGTTRADRRARPTCLLLCHPGLSGICWPLASIEPITRSAAEPPCGADAHTGSPFRRIFIEAVLGGRDGPSEPPAQTGRTRPSLPRHPAPTPSGAPKSRSCTSPPRRRGQPRRLFQISHALRSVGSSKS